MAPRKRAAPKAAKKTKKTTTTPKKPKPVVIEPSDEAARAGKALAPLAKEINTRFERAEKFESQANDHRIAAALRLAEAKTTAKTAGVPFKKWCETEIRYSYTEAVRLAKIGDLGDEEKVKLALEDKRAASATRMKKLRSKNKTSPKPRPATPFEAAEQALASLDEAGTKGIAEIAAHRVGVALTPKADSGDTKAVLQALKHRFSNLKPASAKVEFLEWAAGEIGYKLISEFDAAAAPEEAEDSKADPGEMPEFLKRNKSEAAVAEEAPKKGRRSRSKKTA